MKKTILALACLLGTIHSAQAQSVTLNIDAGRLQNTTGTASVPTGGLLQLLASPSGTFATPSISSYVGGDNVLVASFAFNVSGGTAETFNVLNSLPLTNTGGATVMGTFTLGGNYTLTAGEFLELRFYPSLTYANRPAAPAALTPFGQVRSSTIEFGAPGGVPTETAWVVPSAGSNVTFEYVTLLNQGTYADGPNGLTVSSFATFVTPIPEPSTYALFACGFAGLIGWKMRRRRELQVLPVA